MSNLEKTTPNLTRNFAYGILSRHISKAPSQFIDKHAHYLSYAHISIIYEHEVVVFVKHTSLIYIYSII